VKQAIDLKGAWAFWWSFRIHPDAEKILKKPFYLYINAGNGEIPIRIQISDWQSSPNNEGIVTPWPNETKSEWQNVNSLGAKKSEKFITWAKAIGIEKLSPVLSKEDFDPAPGLSSKENLLNQMVFGYAYLDPDPDIGPITTISIDGIVKTAFNDFSKANFRIQELTVLRYIASLFTKRFVILTGLSGSGKTKLAHDFASWLSQIAGQYSLVAVGADWTSNENLLGYPDALNAKSYRKPDNGALDLILRAKGDPDHPYFLILDEMNLSHVERYFADFLSAMELSNGFLRLHDDTGQDWDGVPTKLEIPRNLFVIGTVNVDETTYMFSPKVLDRANVIEFRVSDEEMELFLKNPMKPDLDVIAGQGAQYAKGFIAAANQINVVLEEKLRGEVSDELMKFFTSLKEMGVEFGYRTAHEICRFVYFYKELSGADFEFNAAMDASIMQKLLPKLHGSKKKLGPVLGKLKELCVARFPVSTDKIVRMQNRLAEHGFTSFAEA